MNYLEHSVFTEPEVVSTHDGTNDAQKVVELDNLGLTQPAPHAIVQTAFSFYPIEHFITVAFPLNCKFKIKHVELLAQGRSRIVFSDIKYGDCTQEEQYRWLMHCMTTTIYQICDYYDIFFEYTKSGNIHLHGRLGYEGKKKSMKDVRSLIHRMFGCSTQYIKFVDIKKYDETKWNDYSVKYKKTYQSTLYPHFTNIQ